MYVTVFSCYWKPVTTIVILEGVFDKQPIVGGLINTTKYTSVSFNFKLSFSPIWNIPTSVLYTFNVTSIDQYFLAIN